MAEERCYLCGRGAKELEVFSKSLRSPVLDWVVDEVKARIEMLAELQQTIQDWLYWRAREPVLSDPSHNQEELNARVKYRTKMENLLDKIVQLSKVDPHANTERGGITYTIYGGFTSVMDEVMNDEKFRIILSRVTADAQTMREALARFEREANGARPVKLELHRVSVPYSEVSSVSDEEKKADEIGKEFDAKFTHADVGRGESGVSLGLDGLDYTHRKKASAFEVPVCSICMHLLKKTPTDDGYYDDDERSHHDDGLTDFPAEDFASN